MMIFSRKMVIPRVWIRKEVVFYSGKQTTRRMGQSRWIDDDKIWRERTPSFPCHESIVPRNAQKQRRWKIIDILLRRLCHGWMETTFRTIISVNQLSIYGVVSDLCEEYESCHVWTERLVLRGQSDSLFVSTIVTKTLTTSTNDPA